MAVKIVVAVLMGVLDQRSLLTNLRHMEVLAQQNPRIPAVLMEALQAHQE